MHINAPIQVTGDGTRWSMCAKCRKVFGLSEGFVEGSHLCCGGCGQNLLLKKMSMVEWEALAEQYPQPLSPVMAVIKPSTAPMWECTAMRISSEPLEQQGVDAMLNHSLAAVSALYKVPVSRLLGSPSTAEAENEIRTYHVELAMDASQRNEKLKQELIRQCTNAAAYKLGRISKRMNQRCQVHANICKKEIKDYLATCLVLIGCSYTEAGEIISELVEGLKNV